MLVCSRRIIVAVKNYCVSDDCKVVRTGFHLENYPVCTHCKEEVTETFYEHHKNREAFKEALREGRIDSDGYEIDK